MPIVTLQEVLTNATKQRYAVGMFDVHNLEMTKAVIQAAEQEKSPVILALAEVHCTSVDILEELSNIMVHAARRASIPVCVHFDHGTELENLIRVMRLGFSSVMLDGSTLPYEENIKKTAEAVKMASKFSVSVEGELGHIGGGEGGSADCHTVELTEPDKAAAFVARSGVQALAVSIGTVHGVYKSAPELDINRLRSIRSIVDIPLVLHGGSGLTDLDFCTCIKAGISKINIYTEIAQAAMNCINHETNTGKNATNYYDLMRLSTVAMKDIISQKLRLFRSAGQA